MIRIGTRTSKLAMIQTELVKQKIQEHFPKEKIEIVPIITKGDVILHQPLASFGGKGVFTQEIEQQLLDKTIDIAVHSAKDMPMEFPEGLGIGAVLKRGPVEDVIVTKDGTLLKDLKPGSVVGTGSLRRELQIKKINPLIRVKLIRGNVQTRLRKLDEGQYSALILAAAGLKRLGLESRINRYFTADEIIPAAGQGILAVQGRKGEAYDFLEGYCDKDAWTAGSAERAFVKLLDGGCSSPVAAHAEILGDEIYLRGLYYNEKDGSYVTGTLRGNKADAENLGRELAETLRKKGENR